MGRNLKIEILMWLEKFGVASSFGNGCALNNHVLRRSSLSVYLEVADGKKFRTWWKIHLGSFPLFVSSRSQSETALLIRNFLSSRRRFHTVCKLGNKASQNSSVDQEGVF